MITQKILEAYYKKSPFGEDGGISQKTIYVYAGPYLIPIPNIALRQSVVVYHDLHHIISGYSNSRIGEGEVGAWELATNCWNKPLAVYLNLCGMATGILYAPKRMMKAFMQGCCCTNLYDLSAAELLDKEFTLLQSYVFDAKCKGRKRAINQLRFAFYFCAALAILPGMLIVGWLYQIRRTQ